MIGRRRREPISETTKWLVLLVGLVLIAIGYAVLAVPPDAEPLVASRRAFGGVGLVIGGALIGLISRIL